MKYILISLALVLAACSDKKEGDPKPVTPAEDKVEFRYTETGNNIDSLKVVFTINENGVHSKDSIYFPMKSGVPVGKTFVFKSSPWSISVKQSLVYNPPFNPDHLKTEILKNGTPKTLKLGILTSTD